MCIYIYIYTHTYTCTYIYIYIHTYRRRRAVLTHILLGSRLETSLCTVLCKECPCVLKSRTERSKGLIKWRDGSTVPRRRRAGVGVSSTTFLISMRSDSSDQNDQNVRHIDSSNS